jgi:hypothetical protein
MKSLLSSVKDFFGKLFVFGYSSKGDPIYEKPVKFKVVKPDSSLSYNKWTEYIYKSLRKEFKPTKNKNFKKQK